MKSSFQIIITIFFGVAFVVAILAFSGVFGGKSGSSTDGPSGNVVIWGVLSDDVMQQFVNEFNTQNLGYSMTYKEHSLETFNQDLIVALANGNQPSLLIFPSELFMSLKSKLYVIPYEAYTQRAFFDTNIEGSKIFLSKDGIPALPLIVDPTVVYYNKDILYGANIINPPSTWGDLQKSVSLLTKKDNKSAIIQSTIALGTSQNINNLREIISAMFLQTGNPIVSYDINTDESVVSLGQNENSGALLADALNFYTSFSDPTSANYSWNSSFNNSLEMFLSGRLAFYIGRASELFNIRAKNPNLNFDVMELFKTNNNQARQYTYGSFIGIGMLKNGLNIASAYPALNYITSKESIDFISKATSLPPTRRDLIFFQQKDPYVEVFFKSALSTFSWLDPSPMSTENIFRGIIKDITSGRIDSTSAIYELSKNLQSNIR